jgi:ABC-type amino acid transport substrate-binding protein
MRARGMDRSAPILGGAAVTLLLVIGLAVSSARAEIKTVEPGVLNVGLNGDMPMTSVKDGKLTGSDGEIMALIAERLGIANSRP